MSKIIDKVTAFVTRETRRGLELLLFEHPHAGIQIPAGTVNFGETPEQAALREVEEETGLTSVRILEKLGVQEGKLPSNQRVIVEHTKVYSRPDLTSFDWAIFRPGIMVFVEREIDGFSQVVYLENDREPNPIYVSMQIIGWVPDHTLADTRRRHFFLLEFSGQTEDRWENFSDNHTFSPFWASLRSLPEIISPQDNWVKYLRENL